MENKETFQYTYSAKEQEEIKAIREKYAPAEETEDKMLQLRRLDAGVTQKATTVALVLGVVGALILGLGMSLAMTELGTLVGVSSGLSMLLGIVIGVAGIGILSLAYPTYQRVVKKERARVAPEILRLTDELMK